MDYEYEDNVSQLRETVSNMRIVSDQIHEELVRQNDFISKMNDGFHKGTAMLERLNMQMKRLYKSSGLSPMTLMFIFTVCLILFLWIYWKIKA